MLCNFLLICQLPAFDSDCSETAVTRPFERLENSERESLCDCNFLNLTGR